MKKSIAENMCQLMKESKLTIVWYGDINLIDECARISNINCTHPKERIQRVLNALDKSTFFTKGYITADFSGIKRKYRTFKLNV